jgi:8-oxo-dGTP diphosphatase
MAIGNMRETRVLCEVVLSDREGKILILRRSSSDKRRPGQWDVPGGHLDPGELLVGAAARELQEESGLALEPRSLRLVYAISGRRGDINAVWLFFAGQLSSNETIKLSDEHSEYKWVNLEQAIDLIEYDLQVEALTYIRDNNLLEMD